MWMMMIMMMDDISALVHHDEILALHC